MRILGREVSLRKKQEVENEKLRYNYYEENVKQPLELSAGLKTVFEGGNLRDCANYELDCLEAMIKNREEEKELIKQKGSLSEKDLWRIRNINEEIVLLKKYKALLFRNAFIGAAEKPQIQRKLQALAKLFYGHLDMENYRPRLHVLIDYVWSISWRITEGRVPPPIIKETGTIFPMHASSGEGLNRIPQPGVDEE